MELPDERRIGELLAPYLGSVLVQGQDSLVVTRPDILFPQLRVYLGTLLKWNARTNLTAIRDPEEIVRRHFGESLFAGRVLSGILGSGDRILDVGSGAGFPGLPIQLLLPGLEVTLSESQGKKAGFLREVCRELGTSPRVWSGRVEDLPPDETFRAVTMRAVDRREQALAVAWRRVDCCGWLLSFGTVPESSAEAFPVPGGQSSYVVLQRRSALASVPRETP